jgi:protein associated with RNAse G/E
MIALGAMQCVGHDGYLYRAWKNTEIKFSLSCKINFIFGSKYSSALSVFD